MLLIFVEEAAQSTPTRPGKQEAAAKALEETTSRSFTRPTLAVERVITSEPPSLAAPSHRNRFP
jgi:hypothetical protein